MSRIGLLGGTFDPPHIGHFIIAQEVKKALELDEVWFMPNNQLKHKEPTYFSSETRIRMIKQATASAIDFFVEPIEHARQGKSYTIDTIKLLKDKYPQISFYFIIGADMVEYMPKWHKIEELITLIDFVGVNRKDYTNKTDYPVTMADIPVIDISSTEIRSRMKEGLAVRYFLPH